MTESEKAEHYDAIASKLEEFYKDESGPGLLDIGEFLSEYFGYL